MNAQAAHLNAWLLMAGVHGRAHSHLKLIERARRGDPAAFEEIVRQHENRIYNLAYRTLRHREDAEDITQEAFLKAFEALARLREEASFGRWLYRIAANLCIARLRSAARNAEVPADPFAISEMREEIEHRSAIWRSEDIQGAVARLLPKYRLALAAFYIEGRSYEEAARLAGVPVRTFKTRLYRARKMLRQLLAESDV